MLQVTAIATARTRLPSNGSIPTATPKRGEGELPSSGSIWGGEVGGIVRTGSIAWPPTEMGNCQAMAATVGVNCRMGCCQAMAAS